MPETNTNAKWREFLALLASGKATDPSELPRWLSGRARRALSRARGGQAVDVAEVEDLMNEFLFKLWTHAQALGGFAALQREWAAWTDARVAGTCAKMLFHLAVETSDAWDDVRAMRRAVRLSVERGLPAANGEMPGTLISGGRLSLPFVARALAELLAEPSVEGRGVNELATRLLALFPSPGATPVRTEDSGTLEHVATHDAFDVEALNTARAVAREFTKAQGESGVRVLRLRDGGVKGVAVGLGVALATAHRKSLEVIAAFKKVARAHEASFEEQVLALQLLEVRARGVETVRA